jgi:hypothetical protein
MLVSHDPERTLRSALNAGRFFCVSYLTQRVAAADASTGS